MLVLVVSSPSSALAAAVEPRRPERRWSRAAPGETPPARAVRLQGHREHQARQKARRLARLDALLDRVAVGASEPCGALDINWGALPVGCDPCGAARRMQKGMLRGERKRESVAALAWWLEGALEGSGPRPTVIDAGCGTGSLLLPLAALFRDASFVGVDCTPGSIERLAQRAASAGPEVASRVTPWLGRIEEYDGPCDVVLSLHACGGASDAALHLAAERCVPYAVSPCCIGKLRRGPASQWLGAQLGEVSFALLAAWADSSSHAGAGGADDARRRRCKALVEADRLAAMRERDRPGRALRIAGEAMATSAQTEVLCT